MPWQAEWSRDLDRDLGMARPRGRVPLLSRLTCWAGLGVVSVLGGAPEAAFPSLPLD